MPPRSLSPQQQMAEEMMGPGATRFREGRDQLAQDLQVSLVPWFQGYMLGQGLELSLVPDLRSRGTSVMPYAAASAPQHQQQKDFYH